MVTTLGSGQGGGSVNIMNLSKPLEIDSSSFRLQRRIRTISTTNFTIWTADCSSNGRNAAIGDFLHDLFFDLMFMCFGCVYAFGWAIFIF